MSTSHEQFGRALAGALGHGPSNSTVRAQERRIVEAASRRQRGGFAQFMPLPRLLAALGIVVAVAVVVGVWQTRSSDQPAPWARSGGATIAIDAELKSKPGESRRLEFSDGSRVEMKEDTTARLVELSPQHTKVMLERGRLSLEVRHRPNNDWTISAGSYRVRVVGTRFSVSYDDEQRGLVVEVAEGRVLVFGEELPDSGISLIAGARFTTRPEEPLPASNTAKLGTTSAPVDSGTRDPASGAQPSQKPGAPVRTAEAMSWRDLATQGKYGEAVAAAEQQGFESLVATLSDGDLLLLANSARFSGRKARAKQGFHKLRTRFSGRPAAVLASFYLARLALDDRDAQLAARWFKTYLRESPRGELAASARVELMNILLRAGDQAGARRIAQQYLDYHPAGAHASLARSVIERVPAQR